MVALAVLRNTPSEAGRATAIAMPAAAAASRPVRRASRPRSQIRMSM